MTFNDGVRCAGMASYLTSLMPWSTRARRTRIDNLELEANALDL